MGEKWVRMTSASPSHSAQWDVELEWILAHRFIVGVRLNVGFSDAEGIAATTTPGPSDYYNLEYILRRLAAAGLKVQLDLGGEGPPMTTPWKNLNKDDMGNPQEWLSPKRPPLGTNSSGVVNYGIVNATRAIKNSIIAKMFGIYQAAGLDPYRYCHIELWNEPSVGGAGAPDPDSDPDFYGTDPDNSGIVYSTSIGLWDSPSEATNLTTYPWLGASFLEFFTKECDGLETLGLPCVSPSFTCKHLFEEPDWGGPFELETFDRDVDDQNWINLIRSRSCLSFGLSCYYSTCVVGTSGCTEELYIWPSLGPKRYAETAVWGYDGDGAFGLDINCMAIKIAALRAHPRIAGAQIIVNEAGIKPAFMAMTDEPETNVVGSMAQNYWENYQSLGAATLAYMDELAKLGTVREIQFTVTNTDGGWGSRFGIFADTLELFNGGGLVNYTFSQTFSSALAYARRAGLPLTGVALAYGAAFWGTSLVAGEEEKLPNYTPADPDGP